MAKILSISDQGTSTGFGRIAAKIDTGLVKRGHTVMGASIAFDGLLPPMYDGERLPYHVAALQPYMQPTAGRPFWTDQIMSLVNASQPDVIWVTQDAPYGDAVRNLPLDWSKYVFICTTPVDGSPIFPGWVEMMKRADGALTISEFGVKAYAEAGVKVGLCRPGIEHDKFFRLSDEKRLELRAKTGIEPDAYVHGVMCQHQGRKAIPPTIKAFNDFAKDKPTARLLLDMDAVSPAGWHLPALFEQFGLDASKVIFRADAVQRGLLNLNERYNILDSHSVLAYREGFGLPVLESMAAGAVSMAQDWCAGTEVLENGRGILIPSVQLEGEDYWQPSTWGNALDKLPNYKEMTRKLQWLYDNPDERRAMAKRGMEWARTQTWETAVDNAIAVLEKALAKKRAVPVPIAPLQAPTPAPVVMVQPPPQSVSVDGMQAVQLIENK